MGRRRRAVLKAILGVLVVLIAAGGYYFYKARQSRPTEALRTGPLEKRVGGQEGIEELVHEFVGMLTKDERLRDRFTAIDRPGLEKRLSAFLCEQVGGGCKYEGKPMAEAHGELGITGEEFAAFMELFIVSMNNVELPQQEQNDLIDVMMALEGSVVKE